MRRSSLFLSLAVGAALACATAACGKSSKPRTTASMGSGGESGSGGVAEAGASSCTSAKLANKRLVRLSFRQIVRSLESLLGPALAEQVETKLDLQSTRYRSFVPSTGTEGTTYGEQNLGSLDEAARMAGAHVRDNFDALTGCAVEGRDACARAYLLRFAEQAYRRPLRPDEQERLEQRFAGFLGLSPLVTIEQALEHGVAAVIHSPQFLYRSELGDEPHAAGPLTPHEIASQLAYFLTDGPPDAALLDAAADGGLAESEGIETQAKRLLELEATRSNLQSALVAYFGLSNVLHAVISDQAFTSALRESMWREGELFLRHVLWQRPLNDVLLSRDGFVNASLAELYGLPQFPPAGVALDENGFAQVTLPAHRAGILTQPGFLTSRSRPDGPSIVARGLLVRNAFVCTQSPPPPEGVDIPMEEAPPPRTPREAAEALAKVEACAECHDSFDPYGIALETFDVLGRYREVYPNGTRIEPGVTLPEEVGGRAVANAVEMAEELAHRGIWARCLTRSMFDYADAEFATGHTDLESCAVEEAVRGIDGSRHGFADVLLAVARSEAFVTRAVAPLP